MRIGSDGEPMAQKTVFGWVLSGPVQDLENPILQAHHSDVEINSVLRKFWELEEMPFKKFLTPEEKICEEHFVKNHTRDQDGRFVVSLPFNSQVKNIGSSRDQAVSRLNQLERRFRKYPERKKQYVQFMKEYEQLNHMEKISPEEITKCPNYYLPHHFVVKEDSSSTKLRVVFDGSAKTNTGVSLNNALMVGPTIQDDLFTLLLRFRCHLIALKAI